MRDLFILISAKFRTLLNSGRSFSSRAKFWSMTLIGILFWFGIFFGSWWLFSYIRSVEVEAVSGIELLGDLLNRVILSLVFLVFISVLIFSNIVTSLSSFLLADDLELLRALPVNEQAFFFSRFIETTLESSWMLFLFGLPVLFGYGAEYKAPISYYLLIFATVIPFILVPAGLGIIIVLSLVNIFPARRIQDILLLLTIIAGGMILLLIRLIQPEKIVNPEAQETVFEFLLVLKQPMNIWLPNYWASEVLIRGAQGKFSETLFFLLLLWTTGLAVVFLAELFSSSYYLDAYSKTQEATRAPISRSGPFQRIFSFFSKFFHPSFRQILVKDIKTFLRDTAQWSQLFLLAVLIIIYIFNFRVLPLDKLPVDQFSLKNAVSYLNMGLVGFVLSALGARFVFPMVSLEGRAFWIIKSSPVSIKKFLWSKFWLGWAPLTVVAELLILLTNHYLRVSGVVYWITSITIFIASFALVSLALSLGAIYPRFNIDNPAKIAVGFGGVIYMILAMSFMLFLVVLEAYPTAMLFLSHIKSSHSDYQSIILLAGSFIFVSFLSLVVLHYTMRYAISQLEKMEF